MKRAITLITALLLIAAPLASCSKPLTKMSASELLDLGEKYLLDMDYEQAIVYFEQLIAIEPRNQRGYTGLAEAYLALDEVDDAIDILHDGFDELSDNNRFLRQLADIYEEIIDEFPSERDAYIGLADVYVALGRIDDAIAILEQGLEQLPNNTRLRAMLNELRPPEPLPEPTAMLDPNLINTMPETDYQKLNEYFMLFESNYDNLGTDLTNMLDDDRNIVNVVLAGEGVPVKQVSEAGGWVYETPDSIVEERLAKYFGIQNINHNGYGIDESLGVWTGYSNGIYRSWNYDGSFQAQWPNAISLTDNGNGTLTAIVDIYHCFDYLPQNWYQHTADWILADWIAIAGENDTSDEYIYHVGQLSIIIRPYDDSYQIVSIDGKNVPKALFADYVAPPPASVAPTQTERQIVADVEGEVSRIRELWLADRNAISSGEYRKESVRSGVTSFWDGDELKMIEVVSGTDGISHLRIYQYENQKLIFAFWEGDDAHRQYYADGYMFRWRYTPKGGNYIDYDNDTNNAEYLTREQAAHSEADALFAEAY
jgi:tetratricopeptide (TPR) repeat protein